MKPDADLPPRPSLHAPDAAQYRQAFRRTAGGVWIITAGHDGARSGFTASSVVSLAPDPPELLVSMQPHGSSYPLMEAAERFGANLLGAAQRPIAERFSSRDVHAGAERYADAPWFQTPDGVWLLDGALAAFSCEIVEVIWRRSHTLVIGRITAMRLGDPAPALVYSDGGYVDIRHD